MTPVLEQLIDALAGSEECYISVLDRGRRIVWFNEKMAAEHGPLSDLQGRKCYEAFAGDTQPHAGCAVETALRTGHLERAVERLGGKPHLILAVPIEDGHIAEIIIEIPEKEHML